MPVMRSVAVVRRLLLASCILWASSACVHGSSDTAHGEATAKAPQLAKGSHGRVLPSQEEFADPKECSSDADCGQPSRARTVLCHHAGFCALSCDEHWGDCNDNYRDGCESPIEHPLY
ncbi:MAG: hypothetical protein RL701_2868, partial [Pseudomonadota bacterium]